MRLYVLLTQEWGEKEEGWRRRTEGGDSEWRRAVPDRFVLVTHLIRARAHNGERPY